MPEIHHFLDGFYLSRIGEGRGLACGLGGGSCHAGGDISVVCSAQVSESSSGSTLRCTNRPRTTTLASSTRNVRRSRFGGKGQEGDEYVEEAPEGFFLSSRLNQHHDAMHCSQPIFPPPDRRLPKTRSTTRGPSACASTDQRPRCLARATLALSLSLSLLEGGLFNLGPPPTGDGVWGPKLHLPVCPEPPPPHGL